MATPCPVAGVSTTVDQKFAVWADQICTAGVQHIAVRYSLDASSRESAALLVDSHFVATPEYLARSLSP